MKESFVLLSIQWQDNVSIFRRNHVGFRIIMQEAMQKGFTILKL